MHTYVRTYMLTSFFRSNTHVFCRPSISETDWTLLRLSRQLAITIIIKICLNNNKYFSQFFLYREQEEQKIRTASIHPSIPKRSFFGQKNCGWDPCLQIVQKEALNYDFFFFPLPLFLCIFGFVFLLINNPAAVCTMYIQTE